MTEEAVKDTTQTQPSEISPVPLVSPLPPTEVQLTELEVAKLAAALATIQKTDAEIQLLHMQVTQEIQKRKKLMDQLGKERLELLSAVCSRLGVPDLDAYDVDPKTGKGSLRRPPGK